MDESRRLKATVHLIPLLDEDYTLELHFGTQTLLITLTLAASLKEANTAISEIEDYVNDEEQELVNRAGSQDRTDRSNVGARRKGEKWEKQRTNSEATVRHQKPAYDRLSTSTAYGPDMSELLSS